MGILLASILALSFGSTISSAQAASQDAGRWCVINAGDNARHCYFQRHRDCVKAISDGNGICVPSEIKRGEMLDDRSK
jgi:hypothetical protein